MLDRSPWVALNRLTGARDETLGVGERVFCLGLEAAALWRAGQPRAAVASAQTALDILRTTQPVIGIGYVGIPAVAEVMISAAEAERLRGGSAASEMKSAREACKAVQAFADRIDVCRPRAALASGRLALLEGDPALAAQYWRRGLAKAKRFNMPMDVSACELALAAVANTQGRPFQLRKGVGVAMHRAGRA
jgi:hypothetical protein